MKRKFTDFEWWVELGPPDAGARGRRTTQAPTLKVENVYNYFGINDRELTKFKTNIFKPHEDSVAADDGRGTTVDHLPDEVLSIIFEYLSKVEVMLTCARVSRRWRCVSERRALCVRRRYWAGQVLRGTRAALIVAYPLDLSAALRCICARARMLRELCVHEAVPFFPVHLAALDALPHLRHLDVFRRPRILDWAGAAACRHLRTLVLNESVAPDALAALGGSRLRELHMYGRALHYRRSDLLALLAAHASQFTELTLRCTELPDYAFAAAAACPRLTALRLYSCWRLTSEGAVWLPGAGRLRVLHLTGAHLLRPYALRGLLARLPPDLLELALSGGWFGDEHVRALATRAPGLRVLELWGCRLSAAGALALAEALPCLRQLDLDVPLTHAEVSALARHSSLRMLRCTPLQAPPRAGGAWYVRALRVVRADARYARKYFRSEGDGFRAKLYHHWARELQLEPLPADLYSDA